MTTAESGPLKNLRVIELGQLVAGPFCGQLLGDMGAEVIKVEPPGAGDPMRQWGRGDAKLWWEVIARNKKSVSANLRTPQGQDLVRRLVATADVVIENFRPGTLEKWNLSPEELQQINPRLVMVRVSGYGQTGPYASRAGFGGIGEAMGGLRYVVGDPDRPPSRVGISLGDSLAATYGCIGALAALNERTISGRGQVIDTSLYESVLQVMESLVPEYTASGLVRERSGSVLPGIAPSNVYKCKDGEFLIGANQDGVFRRLCAAMGRPELAEDPRYASHTARGNCQAELDDVIESWTSGFTIASLEELLVRHGVPSGRIFRAPDMIADPHFAARNSLVNVEHPEFGTLTMQGVFPRLSRTPGRVAQLAPREVGQDNEAVYGDLLGLSAEAIAALQADGVV